MRKNLLLSLTLLLLGISISPPVSVFADTLTLTKEALDLELAGGEVEGYGENSLYIVVEFINILFAFLATVLFISLAKGNSFFGYTAIGTALLGATRVFYILADRGLIFVHDDTLEMWWHLIFYPAIAMYMLGWQQTEKDTGGVRFWAIASFMFTITIFSTAEMLDKPFLAVFDGTFWDAFGVQHFIAFGISLFAIVHMNAIKRQGNAMYAKYFFWVYGLFGLDHFWELLTESWEIIVLEEVYIERVEQIIVLPVFIILFTMAYRIKFPKKNV